MKKPKAVVWDLEFNASQNYRGQLCAHPGYILCLGWKEVGTGKAQTISMLTHPGKDPTDDSKLVKAIEEVLSTVDLHVVHYGLKCDIPFLQTRLDKHNLKRLPTPLSVVDTWKVAKTHLAMKPNSLASLGEFYGIEEDKLYVPGSTWHQANAGVKSALKIVERRCKSDIVLTEKVYQRMLPLINDYPAVYKAVNLPKDSLDSGRPKQCQACGHTYLRKNGLTATPKTVKQRYRCDNCGVSVFVVVPSKFHKDL